MKIRLIEDWKKQLKSYSFISLVGIFLTCLSTVGFAAAGVLASKISILSLVGLVIVFSLLGLVGRFVDQTDGDGNTI